MRYSFSAVALFAATVGADGCKFGSVNDGGNYYCQQVNSISYVGVGGSASYNKITSMDSTTGSCTSSPCGYSGNTAPLNEELSLHVRGPTYLKQLAVYTPGCSSTKEKATSRKTAKRSAHARRHMHGHSHAHFEREEKRDPELGALVSAVIDGKTVSWKNEYSGEPANTPQQKNSGSTPPKAPSFGGSSGSSYFAAKGSSGSSHSAAKGSIAAKVYSASSSDDDDDNDDDDDDASCDRWSRIAYYDAVNQSADGLVFLNHEGGSGSGTFDYSFGNSLSYASPDGCSGSSEPQILADCTIPSDSEIVIMSDRKCSEGSGCGYSREGTVAYHGFGGDSKMFVMEFSMPDDGKTGASKYDPVNMPAIWLLNAQIPRTLQYGNAECSCWTTGCGECDLFEVLAPGDTRCKSTLHGNIKGGSSDYFLRPTNGTIKAAALLHKNNIHIKILDDDTDFGKTMGDSFIEEMIAETLVENIEKGVSVFKFSL